MAHRDLFDGLQGCDSKGKLKHITNDTSKKKNCQASTKS